MIIAAFWLLAALLFALATRVGSRFGIISIVSQLLVATLALPLLMALWVEPAWHLSGAQLVAPVWLKNLYSLAFALVLGHILSDVIDLRLDRRSLQTALPSFCLPFAVGLACGFWLLPGETWLGSLAIGLVFAITAIPVLYLYLSHIGYPEAATRRLVQTAILIDLACWSLFGLAQGSLNLASLLLPLLGAGVPLLLYAIRVRQPWVFSSVFFALLVAAEHYRLNALIYGVGYLLCMAALKVPFIAPVNPRLMKALQTFIAVPLLLTYGVVQIDVHGAASSLSGVQIAALLLLPIASKLLGNWLGLSWLSPVMAPRTRWRESLLLNIRGLSEIVFLNLLLQQQLISPAVYFVLMLMGLIATLLPALAGLQRLPIAPSDARSTCVKP